MKSEYYPPIRERETDELLVIIENTADWKNDALSEARSELIKRGYSINQQNRREKSRTQFNRRVINIRKKASFSGWEMFFLFALAPFILSIQLSMLPIPTGSSTWTLKDDGFQRKWKQRLILLTMGNTVWFLMLTLIWS